MISSANLSVQTSACSKACSRTSARDGDFFADRRLVERRHVLEFLLGEGRSAELGHPGPTTPDPRRRVRSAPWRPRPNPCSASDWSARALFSSCRPGLAQRHRNTSADPFNVMISLASATAFAEGCCACAGATKAMKANATRAARTAAARNRHHHMLPLSDNQAAQRRDAPTRRGRRFAQSPNEYPRSTTPAMAASRSASALESGPARARHRDQCPDP